MPPTSYNLLIDASVPEGSALKPFILELLERKRAGDERFNERSINPINEFLEERLAYFERLALEEVWLHRKKSL